MQQISGSEPPDFSDARMHDLYVQENPGRFYWKIADQGVALAADRIAWFIDGERRERKFSDILSIHLMSAWAGKSGSLGLCRIVFRDGVVLAVYGGDARGIPDDTQGALYGDFLHDLHGRIVKSGTKGIRFDAGVTQGRYAVLTVAVAAGVIMFGVIPAGLLVWKPSLEVLGVAAGAFGLAYAFWRVWKAAKPRSYEPDDIPEELIP